MKKIIQKNIIIKFVQKIEKLIFLNLPIYVRAARMIYLNKACFNGLYRVNSKGLFNVPSGKKTKVTVFDKDNFKSLKKYFTNNDITILNDDFTEAVKKARKGDFVYFDPPYDTIENKKNIYFIFKK